MASYNETIDYFKALCEIHPNILHDENAGRKKFFRLNIEEFLSGSVRELPDFSSGAFMVLINYINSFQFENGQTKTSQQIMFYILQGYKNKDFDMENSTRVNTESISNDILLKMREDSREGHTFFKSSFDQLNKVRLIPAEIKTATGLYVGWQVNVMLDRPHNSCFNPLIWQ